MRVDKEQRNSATQRNVNQMYLEVDEDAENDEQQHQETKRRITARKWSRARTECTK